MKIVFIPNLPYTYRDHKRFGVEYFMTKGYDIEVMDVHKVLIPGYKEKVDIEYFTFDKHWEPETEHAIIKSVQKLTEKDFIFFYINSKKAIDLLYLIKYNTKARFITYSGGTIPPHFCSKKLKENIKYFILDIFHKIDFRYKKTFPLDFFVAGSKMDEKKYYRYNLLARNTKIIKANSMDYDLILNLNSYHSSNSNKYFVFIDTDVIDASDYVLYGIEKKIDIQKYTKILINFLKWVESEYKLKVIICAHPKSRIYKGKTEIDGIKIEFGKTQELVKNSEFIINEGSTAISYGIIFNKPIIFITFDIIDFFYHNCYCFAKALNKKVLDIEKIDKLLFEKELLKMDMYERYRLNYLTYINNEKSTFDIVNDKLFSQVNGSR